MNSSPISAAIDRALSAPAPTLRYLAPNDVFNLNDVLELASGPLVVGHSPLYRPGQEVTEADVKNWSPRRYSA